MELKQGTKVRHKKDRALGLGEIGFIQPVGQFLKYFVSWPSRPNALEGHTAEELEPVLPVSSRLASGNVGEASLTPFVLRVMGRWFEARHAVSGELSNQPFQMLPHQVIVANRVVNSAPDNRRWLIADDVGLGKTIEAGMIMEVLRKRSLGRFRCLIVTPAGLMAQWKDEMELRFARRFRIFTSSYANDLEDADLLVASIDTLKIKRLEGAIKSATAWDMVIFDEAHHLATETHVQKYALVKLLRDNNLARNMLFLTATPHSGNSEHFWNMLRLLREDLFESKADVSRADGRLNQVMIRNRKSEVTDVRGARIFQGVAPAQIIRCEPAADEVAFYEELLEFVRKGYGVADKLRKQKDGTGNAVGFLMSTFKKLASSSRAAIRRALENRLRALEGDEVDAPASGERDARFEGEEEERSTSLLLAEAGGGKKGKRRVQSPIEDEIQQIKKLLRLLSLLKAKDSKLAFFVKNLKGLPADTKVLIFTEYRGTQDALVSELEEAFGKQTVTFIHGSMDLPERRAHVEEFNESLPNPRFMVSTEAGGEGLNMQKSCHVIMNYDLPWNPMRLQQRIGRVYRYGQKKQVQIFNVQVDSTSEAFADARVEEYLRIKIGEITKRLAEVQDGNPEDIQSEVLGHIALNMSVNELYEQALKKGEEAAKKSIDAEGRQIEKVVGEGMLGIFKGLKRFDVTDYEKAAAHVTPEQLEFFVRQYLGGQDARLATADGLFSFDVPKALQEVSLRLPREDKYEAREAIKDKRVERATVDKEKAQRTLGCRLLRFGDVVFDAMVRHVQDSDYSDGVATLSFPPSVLGWSTGDSGTCALFDLKILRQEGSAGGARVLREELAAFTVRAGGEPTDANNVLESMHRAECGSLLIDAAEVDRAYAACRATAEARLEELRQAVVREYQTAEAIVPQIDDLAVAWVEAK